MATYKDLTFGEALKADAENPIRLFEIYYVPKGSDTAKYGRIEDFTFTEALEAFKELNGISDTDIISIEDKSFK